MHSLNLQFRLNSSQVGEVRFRDEIGSATYPPAAPRFGLLLANLQSVQQANGLSLEAALDSRTYTVEMETGTGKTYGLPAERSLKPQQALRVY